MGYILLFFLSISFVLILGLEYKFRSVSIVLWGGLFVFFLLPHSVDIFITSKEYTEANYNKASLFALLFNIFYLATRLLLINARKLGLAKLNRIEHKNLNIPFIEYLFILLLISFAFLLYFVISTFGGFFGFTWIDMFEGRGAFSLTIFNYLFSMTIPLFFLTFFYKNKFVFLGTLVIIICIIFLFRIRAYIIPLTVPFVAYFILSKYFKFNIFSFFKLLILSLSTIILIVGLGVFKAYGTLSNFYNNITFDEFAEGLYNIAFSKYGELGLRNGFYFYLENNNKFENFGLGLGYIRLMMMPIPSFMSFGLKPQDFAMDMAMAYDPINSTPGVNSMHPTLYGDVYANLGWFGILLGIFWAFFVFVGDYLAVSKSKNIFLISLFVTYSFAYTLIARGAIYNGVFSIFFILVTHSILLLVLKVSRKKYFR